MAINAATPKPCVVDRNIVCVDEEAAEHGHDDDHVGDNYLRDPQRRRERTHLRPMSKI